MPIIFERSLAEWDSRIRRLSPFPELTIWVDAMLIGVDLMGELHFLPEDQEADPQALGRKPHPILEPIFQASIEGYLEAT